MSAPDGRLRSARHRRQVVLGTLRSLASSILLVALYYLLPLDRLASVPLAVILVVGLALLVAAAVWQLRLILRARYPGMRAAEALATTVPLFLLLFASSYFAIGRANPANFSQHLTRTDALYFTVTTFSTVGYGDITAVSQAARLVVTAQMLLDLLALGLGIKLFVAAARIARQAQPGTADPDTIPPQRRLRLLTVRVRPRSGTCTAQLPRDPGTSADRSRRPASQSAPARRTRSPGAPASAIADAGHRRARRRRQLGRATSGSGEELKPSTR
jgi:voltage-gated potassium channel